MLKTQRFAAGVTLGLTLALLMPTPFAWAGAEPLTPGAVGQTLRPFTSPSPNKEVTPLPEVSTPSPAQPPDTASDRRVKVQHFVITGNTVFTEAELNAVLSDLTGADLSLAEIYAAADRLTDYYQSRGYSLSTVTVPAQKMRDGILRLEVVEGRVGKVVIAGNERYATERLSRHFEPIKPGTIIRLTDLKREVLLLNDLPGLLARSAILPGEAYGTSDIHLMAEETPVEAIATLDNQGPKIIGQWRLGADFTINNPGRFGDLLGLGYTHSESGLLRQGRFFYGLPVTHDGTRLNLSYSRAEYDVGGEFDAFDIEGLSETARLQLNHPLIRSRGRNLSLTLGLAHILGQSDIDTIPLSDDEVNFLESGVTFELKNNSGGVSSLAALFASNFRNNPEGTDGAALPPSLKLNASHEHLLGHGFSTLLRGELLLAADAMPVSNRYYLGGPQTVRGFVSSTLMGDQGGMGSLEIRRFQRVASANLLLRGFLDTGAVRYHQPQEDGSQYDTLASAGAGATLYVTDRYSLDLTWAKPVDGKESGEGHNARLWMALTAAY